MVGLDGAAKSASVDQGATGQASPAAASSSAAEAVKFSSPRGRQRALWLGFALLTAGGVLIVTPAPSLLIGVIGLRTLAPHQTWARRSLVVLLQRCPRRLRPWLAQVGRARVTAA
jgi:Putative transmembrane protein (PGPGW)